MCSDAYILIEGILLWVFKAQATALCTVGPIRLFEEMSRVSDMKRPKPSLPRSCHRAKYSYPWSQAFGEWAPGSSMWQPTVWQGRSNASPCFSSRVSCSTIQWKQNKVLGVKKPGSGPVSWLHILVPLLTSFLTLSKLNLSVPQFPYLGYAMTS